MLKKLENKASCQHRTKLIACFLLTYENPRGFSIRFLFTKLLTKPRNKPYTTNVAQHFEKELKLNEDN
jgi:hypothetical protein